MRLSRTVTAIRTQSPRTCNSFKSLTTNTTIFSCVHTVALRFPCRAVVLRISDSSCGRLFKLAPQLRNDEKDAQEDEWGQRERGRDSGVEGSVLGQCRCRTMATRCSRMRGHGCSCLQHLHQPAHVNRPRCAPQIVDPTNQLV